MLESIALDHPVKMLINWCADKGLDIAVDRYKDIKDKKQANDYLDEMLRQEHINHRYGAIENEFDFDRLEEFIRESFWQDFTLVFISGSVATCQRKYDEVLSKTLYFANAKSNNKEADHKAERITVQALSILAKYYENQIEDKERVLANETASEVMQHTEHTVDGIKDSITDAKEEIINAVNLASRSTISSERQLEHQTNEADTFVKEQLLATLSNHCEWTYQHSGNYILNEIHKELFTDLIDESEMNLYKSSDLTQISLVDFLNKDKYSKSVLVKGPGGAGKTVSMIQTCKAIIKDDKCAIYVPLSKVSFSNIADPIKEYIRKHILGCDDTLFRAFEEIANSSIVNQAVLFLDGANEISLHNLNELYEFLRRAAFSKEWNGVRIVVSSRTDLDIADIKTLEMLPLDASKISSFLEKLSVNLPANKKVLKLISNPLMLGLYADAEKYYESYNQTSGRYRIKLDPIPDTTTKIISNFMKTQLFQMASVSNNDNDFILYHVLLEFALPVIAYSMIIIDRQFTEKDVRNVLKKALSDNDELFNWYSEVMLEDLWWEYDVENDMISKMDIKAIHDFAIKKYRFLYIESDMSDSEGFAVEFLHQEFRDYFAGIYLSNEIQMLEKKGYILKKLGLSKCLFEDEVLEYCGGVLKEDYARPILEKDGYVYPGKQGKDVSNYSHVEKALSTLRNKDDENTPGVSLVVANLLNILRLSRDNNLSECDFSYLDLRKCKMNGCHFSEFYRDRIYSTIFDGAWMNNSFFINEGHADSVVAIAEGIDGWIYSIDEAGWLLGWDYIHERVKRIKCYQGMPVALAFDKKSNMLCVALQNQIVLIDCNNFKDVFSRNNEMDSQYFRYIKFSEHGHVKYAYDLSPLKWYDLFTNEAIDVLDYPILSGCVCECDDISRIIYSMYGRSICVLSYVRSDTQLTVENMLTKRVNKDLENRSRINKIVVNNDRSSFIVAIGNTIAEYALNENFKESLPIRTYSGNATIRDVVYGENGGYILAIGEQVIIIDEQGVTKGKLQKQSVANITCFMPQSNGERIQELHNSSGDNQKYYIISRAGAVQELDSSLNVTRARTIKNPSSFVWVKDRKTGEVQMLFGPTDEYPKGYRFSFETGESIPAGWCYEMKTIFRNIYRREYVMNGGANVVIYDIRDKSSFHEYRNYAGIWIFGCSFMNIRGQLANHEGLNFLKQHGGLVNGI